MPQSLFKELAATGAVKHFKSFVEVNVSFIPYESKVGILKGLYTYISSDPLTGCLIHNSTLQYCVRSRMKKIFSTKVTA